MEDVIKVGEYVRTESGHIARLLEKTEYDYLFDGVIAEPFGEQWTWLSVNDGIKKIVKHSKQLIDLIEIGDILELREYIDYFKQSEKIGISDIDMLTDIKEAIKDKKIEVLSVLTKESYIANYYKVGGNR